MTYIHDISQGQTIDYWKHRAHQAEERARLAEERCAEFASEAYVVEQLVRNPNITDKEKISTIAYYQWYKFTPPARPNGARYYSPKPIAERMGKGRLPGQRQGSGEQAFSPIHTKLIKAGLIEEVKEPQKNDASRRNFYDVLNPQFTLSAASFSLEKSEKAKNRGGRRVPLHRECGGLCIERTTYSCTKCGHTVPENLILMVDEQKWESWKTDAIPCAHCGEELQPGATFCAMCGGEQTGPAPDVADTPGPNMDEENEDESIQLDFIMPDSQAQLPPDADRECIKCHRSRRDCWVPTDEGGWWYSCTPEMWKTA